jgi:DNA mismatch repair protein MutL
VKELLENAIDAGASDIQLIIKDAGKNMVQVVDNGKGMSETDARMSFERHATSKINKADDLFAIKTMGFRGEALASIAAVAQVEMKTCTQEKELGAHIVIEGSEFIMQEPVATTCGTSIRVRNLFFNVPARRNFLKSNPVELRHINEEFIRVALANPNVGFSMTHNDLENYVLRPGKLSQRIVALFGKNYRSQLVTCNEEMAFIDIKGYVGKPEFSKKSRGEQYFFVNNRFIKSPYLNHAVFNAYSGLIADDQYPFFVLFIDIDPSHIDVNVHPTKTEIKFDDEKTVYNLIKSAVKRALGAHNVTPSMDFSFDTNFPQSFVGKINPEEQLNDQQRASKERDYQQFRKPDNPRQDSNLKNWEQLYESALKKESWPAFSDENKERTDPDQQGFVTMSSKANELKNSPDGNEIQEERNIFQLQNTFIVTTVKSGLMMMDQQAAHERILYERYISLLSGEAQGGSQQFLFPETIEMNPNDISLVMELKQSFNDLGFSFGVRGQSALILNGVPAGIPVSDGQRIFKGMLDAYKDRQKDPDATRQEQLARALALNAAVKPGKRLSKEEMISLIDQLFACELPNYSPRGANTYKILNMDSIHQLFNK